MTADEGADPRLDFEPTDLAAADAEAQPLVAKTASGPKTAMIASVFAVAGVGLFLVLNNARQAEDHTTSLVTPAADAMASAPEPDLQLPPRPVLQPASLVAQEPAAALASPPAASMATPASLPPPLIGPIVDPLQRRRAPAVIVDLGGTARGGAAPAASEPTRAPAAGPPSPQLALGGQSQTDPTEAFAARLGGGDGAAFASPMRNLAFVIPQGAVIPAVLETAINSDLPGYTRAVVSRDVRSFDGKLVLIPRGSRLVGQYKSAVSLGQSRAFIIWTRVTRPDGVSVQIASPGTDALGRGGLEGDVERHFFSRFGGSILLSVLNGAVMAIGGTPSTQIAIGSPAQAATAAASAQQGETIPPTVKVPQGEAIRIFVARDLDFSAVGPMK